jgi:hypothetical protein
MEKRTDDSRRETNVDGSQANVATHIEIPHKGGTVVRGAPVCGHDSDGRARVLENGGRNLSDGGEIKRREEAEKDRHVTARKRWANCQTHSSSSEILAKTVSGTMQLSRAQ